MSTPQERIGKSLLKYFKPVRIGSPHIPGVASLDAARAESQGESHVRLVEFEATSEDRYAKAKARGLSGLDGEEAQESAAELPPPPKGPVPWLDLVLYLVGSCRHVSKRITRKTGLESYRRAVENHGRKQAVGNIVDAVPTIKDS